MDVIVLPRQKRAGAYQRRPSPQRSGIGAAIKILIEIEMRNEEFIMSEINFFCFDPHPNFDLVSIRK